VTAAPAATATAAAARSAPPATVDAAHMRDRAASLAQAIADGTFDDAASIADPWKAMRATLGDLRWHSTPYPHSGSYVVWYEFAKGTADLKIDFDADGRVSQAEFFYVTARRELIPAESQTGDPAHAAQLFVQADQFFSRADRGRTKDPHWDTTLEEAIRRYDEAIRADAGNSEAYSGRCTAEFRLRRSADALVDCTHAIRLSAANSMAFLRRGDTLLSVNRLTYMLAAYDEAIRLKPDANLYYNQRAGAYLTAKDFPRCIADATAGLQLAPTANLWTNRANCRAALEQYDAAAEDFTQLIALSKDESSYLLRGRVYVKAKQYQQALDDFNEAIHLKPDDRNAYNDRGFAKDMLGDAAGAAADRKYASEIRRQ
jgi:tetratricopeptide (TPR) repeat protein